MNNHFKHMRMLNDDELLLVRSGAIDDALPMPQVHALLDEMRKSRRIVPTASTEACVATIVATAMDIQKRQLQEDSQDDPGHGEIQTPIATKASRKRAPKSL